MTAPPFVKLRGAVLTRATLRKRAACSLCTRVLSPGVHVWRPLVEDNGRAVPHHLRITRTHRYCEAHFEGGRRYA